LNQYVTVCWNGDIAPPKNCPSTNNLPSLCSISSIPQGLVFISGSSQNLNYNFQISFDTTKSLTTAQNQFITTNGVPIPTGEALFFINSLNSGNLVSRTLHQSAQGIVSFNNVTSSPEQYVLYYFGDANYASCYSKPYIVINQALSTKTQLTQQQTTTHLQVILTAKVLVTYPDFDVSITAFNIVTFSETQGQVSSTNITLDSTGTAVKIQNVPLSGKYTFTATYNGATTNGNTLLSTSAATVVVFM